MTKTCTRAELSVKCDTNCLVAVEDRRWWYFVSTSGVIFVGGLLVILISRLIIRICNSKRTRLNPTKKEGCERKLSPAFEDPRPGVYVRLKEQAATLITAQTFKGRFLVILSFLLSMLYIVLYIVEATFPVEHCLDLENQRLWIFDVGFNVFFLVHFCLRFLAANDKLLFWFETLSIVDCFTIPEVFVSIVVRQNWLGLRFLRAMHFIRLADILQLLGIIHSSGVITLTVMVGNLFALLFTSGGILHLVENTGDPWVKYDNSRELNYFECLYFLVVTMSTVGFGDIYAETYFGRIFMMIFISIGLGMFATYIPAILEYLGSHTIYHGSYKLPDGRKHIILCGYITKHSVEVFLRDFLHEDRSDRTVNIVIMGNFLPGAELESLIKKHFVQVSYFKGTVLSGEDCRRVKMKRADACIVLCNRECVDPGTEDAENIMRVVAIKNYCPGIRVIMQLLQYQNKAYLLNIPSWNAKLGDDVVCISELKLGFIAQSCLSPGFSTLLANIFSMRTNEMATGQNTDHWMTYYIQGASQEMYTETLSMAFKGMAFQQAAEICFEKLGLLLIAIETVKPDGVKIFAINPLDKNMTVEKGTTGYFITGSASEVRRAFIYCVSCHADIRNPEHIKECGCDKGKSVTFRGLSKAIIMTATSNRLQAFHPDVHLKSIEKLSLDHDSTYLSFAPENNKHNGRASERASESKHYFPLPGKSGEGKHGPYKVLSKLKALKEQQASEDSTKEPRFDISGTFYWCEPTCFEDALLTRDEAMKKTFSHHILVCLFNDKDAPLLGLRTLVIPLRASNLLKSELKTVVFLGNQEYMEKEWHQLCNFKDIYILPGSPYCRADLRAVNANLADMAVFLSPATASKADDPKLADKESILASLNLKAMSFDDAVGLLNENTRQAFAGLEFDGNPKVERRGSAYGCNTPMITELVFDQNVQYLDIDDDDDEDLELYVMQPFACGTAFTVSMLDSLMSATYFNPDILTLVRNLVTGGVNQFLEEHIAEGDELRGGLDSAQTAETRSRCKIIQISLFDGPLSQFGGGGSFGEMFLHALRCSSMICLGLYRFRDSNKPTLGTPSAKRYVICCPPYDFVLQPTDLVFVLAHSDPELNRL